VFGSSCAWAASSAKKTKKSKIKTAMEKTAKAERSLDPGMANTGGKVQLSL